MVVNESNAPTLPIDKDTDPKKAKVMWIGAAVEAIDRFNVDRLTSGLRPYFDIKNSQVANQYANYLLDGDYFTFALGSKIRTQKREKHLPALLAALMEIDPQRYEGFIGINKS